MIRIFATNSLPKEPFQCEFVIESGHSSTHFVPFFAQTPLNYAIKRLNIGGRLLTKHLLEIIKFKYLQMKNSIQLVGDIKEKLCYFAKDFDSEIKKRKREILMHYILPDSIIQRKGFATGNLKDINYHYEKLTLYNERFMVPEVVFSPRDIGLDQAGICETYH